MLEDSSNVLSLPKRTGMQVRRHPNVLYTRPPRSRSPASRSPGRFEQALQNIQERQVPASVERSGAGYPVLSSPAQRGGTVTRKDAAAAYARQSPAVGPASSLGKYKDEQLLSNPGGDRYDLDKGTARPGASGKTSFGERVGKDLSDAWGNLKNFFSNLFMGAKFRYRDANGTIQEGRQRGLVGSVVDFFKDLGSALTLGAWRPDGEPEPRGLVKRIAFSCGKIKEAVFGDVVEGVSGSVNHMAEDLVLAGWNLAETVPDATIGNFEAGEKLTTSVFDNGQVLLDYTTDILPAGEAWLRVHSADLRGLKPPILNNLGMPEHNPQDDRWRYVRNTPFRKTIETLGSLAADVLTFGWLGRLKIFSEKRRS